MPATIQYIERAKNPEKRERIGLQWTQAVEERVITCICGRELVIQCMFRCLYCGEWFCARCAEIHFGKTVKEYWSENP